MIKKKDRSAISPFLATVMLVVITLAVGGTLYTQFRQMVVSQLRNPSFELQDSNIASDGQTITITIKNDGNVQLALQGMMVTYGTGKNIFMFGAPGACGTFPTFGGPGCVNGTIISSGSGGFLRRAGCPSKLVRY